MNDYVTKIHLKEKEKYKLTRKNMNILGKSVPANFVSKNHVSQCYNFAKYTYFFDLLNGAKFFSTTTA